MLYCGIAVGAEYHHLCSLEEVRVEEPPIRLAATFFEPGSADEVVPQVLTLGDTVVAIAAPFSEPPEGRPARGCDAELQRRGVRAQPFVPAGRELFRRLSNRGIYAPPEDSPPGHGTVEEGAYTTAPVFETNVEGVFCALQGRRLPARRHPLGVQRRIDELEDDHVIDPDGNLWHRRIEEVEAAAAALAAHRYAVGHACWVGDPGEGVIVLPGSTLPAHFSSEGVMPHVPRSPLGS